MNMTDRDRESFERRGQALKLLGNHVRFHHWPQGSGVLCYRMAPDGYIELSGMAGYFHPSLLEIDGELEAVPVLGTVN